MILQIIIFIFSILGAFFVSSLNEKKRSLGFLFFFINNLLIIYISIENKIYPLTLQVILLSLTTIIGMNNIYNKNYIINISLKYILLLYILSFIILSNLIDINYYFSNNIHKFEIILSLLVLIGNSMISNINENIRLKGFYFFILADIGYLIIYYHYHLYILIINTLLFFLASFKAIYLINKKKKII